MTDRATRRVSDEDIRALGEDGAVALRGVFDAAWIDSLRDGVEQAIADPGPFSKDYAPAGEGSFFTDCPSSKSLGRLSLFHNEGSGSSWIDVKPLGADGSSGGFG